MRDSLPPFSAECPARFTARSRLEAALYEQPWSSALALAGWPVAPSAVLCISPNGVDYSTAEAMMGRENVIAPPQRVAGIAPPDVILDS